MDTNPFISYIVTSHNEGEQLHNLLSLLIKHIDRAEIIVLDDFSTDSETLKALEYFQIYSQVTVKYRKLDGDYAAHKNYANSLAKGRYIMQIDADELPTEFLLYNLYDVLKANPTVDLFWLPRINEVVGITDEVAKSLGFNIDNHNKWVNWHSGDYQGRIYKNSTNIKWYKKLHEQITGAKITSFFPKEIEYALWHKKTVKKQVDSNLRYNKEFTREENMGISDTRV